MFFNKEQVIALGFLSFFFILGVLTYQSDSKKSSEIIKKDSPLKLKNTPHSPLFSKRLRNHIEITISGAIKKPGKYVVLKGSRLYDLIKLAGGLNYKGDLQGKIKNYYLKNGHSYKIPDQSGDRIISHSATRKIVIIEVEIRGAIRKPGVYRLIRGNRINDLIRLAGGYLPGARVNAIKYNYLLKDGDSYYVPKANK